MSHQLTVKLQVVVNNIAAINKLGPDYEFEGVVTIVTETGSTVLINGNDISDYPGGVQPVNGNASFECLYRLKA